MNRTSVWIFVALFILVIGALVYAFLNVENAEHVENNPDPDWKAYINEELGYSTLYPMAFAVNQNHVYDALGEGKEIRGVSFTVPESLTRGTNLSGDTYFSIESLGTTTEECVASAFLGEGATVSTVTENDVRYSVGRRTEGAAGNIYEEHVYAIEGSSPCVATRYFIHSTNLENHPSGEVIEFNRGSLISVFDTIRQSIQFEIFERA